MITNRPAPNASIGEIPSGTKGTTGLAFILNSPISTISRNGASTITRNSFEESPTTEDPAMFIRANAQMKATSISHFADSGPTVAVSSQGRKYALNSTNSTG